jgi:hypothetical protein
MHHGVGDAWITVSRRPFIFVSGARGYRRHRLDERRRTVRRWIIAGIGSVVLTTAVGGALAFASNDSEGGVGGRQADRAIHAALDATRGGTAHAVERDSENGGYWEVEVEKPNGSIVDVRLNSDYSVLVIEGDSETPDTSDAGP